MKWGCPDQRPVPFSKIYVQHIEWWYTQKHPDEDFADTFAMWLTPRSNWRRRYEKMPGHSEAALRRARRAGAGQCRPARQHRQGGCCAARYARYERDGRPALSAGLPGAAGAIRHRPRRASARELFDHEAKGIRTRGRYRRQAPPRAGGIDYRWTGVPRPIVGGLIDSVSRTCEQMKHSGELGEEAQYPVEVTVLATTLAMIFGARGRIDT